MDFSGFFTSVLAGIVANHLSKNRSNPERERKIVDTELLEYEKALGIMEDRVKELEAINSKTYFAPFGDFLSPSLKRSKKRFQAIIFEMPTLVQQLSILAAKYGVDPSPTVSLLKVEEQMMNEPTGKNIHMLSQECYAHFLVLSDFIKKRISST